MYFSVRCSFFPLLLHIWFRLHHTFDYRPWHFILEGSNWFRVAGCVFLIYHVWMCSNCIFIRQVTVSSFFQPPASVFLTFPPKSHTLFFYILRQMCDSCFSKANKTWKEGYSLEPKLCRGGRRLKLVWLFSSLSSWGSIVECQTKGFFSEALNVTPSLHPLGHQLVLLFLSFLIHLFHCVWK